MYNITFKNKQGDILFNQQLDNLEKCEAVKKHWSSIGKFKGQAIIEIIIKEV